MTDDARPKKNLGAVVAVRGSVVDVRFEGRLPPIYSVLRAGADQQIVLEVLEQRDARHVRGIALTPTQGLARGMVVEDTGGPLQAPVGKGVLSRMFDVFGNVIDRRGPLTDVQWRSVHRAPPALSRRSTVSEVFETGIKVIDGAHLGRRRVNRRSIALQDNQPKIDEAPMNARSLALPFLATSLLFAAGCADKETVKPIVSPATPAVVTSGAANSSRNVHVADDIARACKIDFNNIDSAPKFEFDKSALLPGDSAVLEQVATCLTTGPLKGRAVKLVGRADPRGEVEYNMALGGHRAGSAGDYLARLGVDETKIAESSRGELDATGNDRSGWERDRRVDILLK